MSFTPARWIDTRASRSEAGAQRARDHPQLCHPLQIRHPVQTRNPTRIGNPIQRGLYLSVPSVPSRSSGRHELHPSSTTTRYPLL